jgi:small conductance mechanosensitive channel
VAAFLVLFLARLAVRRMHRRMEAAESVTQELDLQRAATLTQAVSYVVRVVVWTVVVLIVLGQFHIDLAPLIAGAGIVGVALGFGAQAIVKDFLSGFFILLENQLAVGDEVTVNAGGQQVTGDVETVSLRTTQIRAYDGTLNTIPNGNVVLVSNRTRGWARAILDVAVAYGEDARRVERVLQELFEELRREPEFRDVISDGPKVLGIERIDAKEVVLRVVADTRPSKRAALLRQLRERIKQRFDERGISVPS